MAAVVSFFVSVVQEETKNTSRVNEKIVFMVVKDIEKFNDPNKPRQTSSPALLNLSPAPLLEKGEGCRPVTKTLAHNFAIYFQIQIYIQKKYTFGEIPLSLNKERG